MKYWDNEKQTEVEMDFDETGKKNCYNCKKQCALGKDVIKFIETLQSRIKEDVK